MLEQQGLQKVSFELGGEKHTVATNDESIRSFLNPHVSSDSAATAATDSSSLKDRSTVSEWFAAGLCDAWRDSCDIAEAQWSGILKSILGLGNSDERIAMHCCYV